MDKVVEKNKNKKYYHHNHRNHHGNKNAQAEKISCPCCENCAEAENAQDIKIAESIENTQNAQNVENADNNELFEVVGVKFNESGKLYYFDPKGMKLDLDTPVIVETARGMEFGNISLANKTVSKSAIVSPLKPVVRIATPQDIRHHEENREKEKAALEICEEKIKNHKLQMKLVNAEYTFDNSKLIFYFTADGRVDFRELVNDLARVFKTRIELRQIGIRDETKLLGGLGMCGRVYCCNKFLGDFVQVSIKMAKEQNLSLNSAKISGACGRLMCCLKYEQAAYEEEIAKTPPVGSTVKTPDGEGIVVEANLLTAVLKIKFGENENISYKTFNRSEVEVINN